MLVKDLKKGNVYYLKCPVNNYKLKPFIFKKIEENSKSPFLYCVFDGIVSPKIKYPIVVLRDSCSNIVDYGTIDARILTPLEIELL
jgi:hypothetical protein